MTKEQKEVLTAWRNNLLVTYRLDYFRGRAIWAILCAVECGSRWNFHVALQYCQEANRLGFESSAMDYIDLLQELWQIEKEVPLSDAAQEAITHVFGGKWEYAIEALDRLRSERNKLN